MLVSGAVPFTIIERDGLCSIITGKTRPASSRPVSRSTRGMPRVWCASPQARWRHSASGHSGAAPICGLANLMFYKFLHTEDIDRVLRESTLKVSSLKYFKGS